MPKLPCHPQTSLFPSRSTATERRHQQPPGGTWGGGLNPRDQGDSAVWMYLGGGTCKCNQEERFILEAGWGKYHLCEKLTPAIMGFIFNVTTKRGGAASTRTAFALIHREAIAGGSAGGANTVWNKKKVAPVSLSLRKLIHQRVAAGSCKKINK